MQKRFRPDAENVHITKQRIFDEQLALLEEDFKQIDCNNDGFVDKNEVLNFLREKMRANGKGELVDE
jgi:Ca2+-binding EF-hand superfamily protein